MGVSKVAAAALRIKKINPGIDVIATATYLTQSNADSLVGQCDLVVDCLDTIPSRFTLQMAARRAGIPMVSAAIAGIIRTPDHHSIRKTKGLNSSMDHRIS